MLFHRNMIFPAVFLILAAISSPGKVSGQEVDLIPFLYAQEDEEIPENPDWLEHLWTLMENPLDLNRATMEDLLGIPFLNSLLAREILKYRKELRGFRRSEELLNIEGLDRELYDAIHPLITVNSPRHGPSFIYRLRIKFDTPERLGFQKRIYQYPFYLHQRLSFQTAYNISGGVVWEKDAGESDFFDYGSFHLQYRHPREKLTIIAGDYHQKIGKGLICWSPYGIPLSPGRLPISSYSASPTRVNTSSAETGFFRGICLNIGPLSNWTLTIFYSHNHLDGSLSADRSLVKTLYFSGLHRTESERNTRGKIQEICGGLILSGRMDNIQVQFAALPGRYIPAFKQTGADHAPFSFSYLYEKRPLQISGEFALVKKKYPAIEQHLFFGDGPIKLEWIGYFYHPLFYSLHGRAFGSYGDSPQNYIGCAVVLSCRLVSNLQLDGYAHIKRTISDPDENPFINRDYTLELSRRKGPARLKVKFTQRYRPGETANPAGPDQSLSSFLFNCKVQLSPVLTMSSQLNLRWAKFIRNTMKFQGCSMYHEITWRRNNLKMTGRWTAFEVPAYDLRIYEPEPDLPGSIRSVLLNGRGFKMLLMISWKILSAFQIDIKYGQRHYPDLQQIGTGLDMIGANRIHEFRFSLIWRRDQL